MATNRSTYRQSLVENTILESLADAADRLEIRAARQATANPRLRVHLKHFAVGLRKLFDETLYPELLWRRAAIYDYEDNLAAEAVQLAPEFVRRVSTIKEALEVGGNDHA